MLFPRIGRVLGLALLLCAVAAPWWNIPRDQADSAGMLAHLHSMFVGADLLYDDEYSTLGMSPLFAFVTDEGVVSNHWPAGASWLQAPGYVLGLVAAKALAAIGIGRGGPMGVVVLLGVRAWALLVLSGTAVAIARMGAAAMPEPDSPSARWAGVGLAALTVLGTPLLYYAAESPLRPHLWGAALCLGVVALWSRPSWGAPRSRTVALAALVGLATYVRPQLAPLCLLVAHDAWSSPDRWRRLVIGALVFVPWPLLHLRTQLWMYGPQLGDYAGEVSHHLSYFLLSTHHGVLPWCPLLGLGLLAMVRSAWLRERGAWLLLALMLMQLWLDGGMRSIEPRAVLGTRTWSGGVSFGPRKLLDVLPLMLPAVLSLTRAAVARRQGRLLFGLAGVLSVPTVLLMMSAWQSPDATTGGIMGWPEYQAALERPFSGAQWSSAAAARRIDLWVAVVVTAVVTVPLLLLALGVARGLHAVVGEREDPLRLATPATIVTLMIMHGWLAVLLMRSDAIREEDDARMLTAAERMTPVHYFMVRQIAAHHERLRRRLGPGAAPPGSR